MRYSPIESEAGKPAPCQMHAQLLDHLALAGDTIQISNQQDAQQQLRINRRATRISVALLQLLAHEAKADVFLGELMYRLKDYVEGKNPRAALEGMSAERNCRR